MKKTALLTAVILWFFAPLAAAQPASKPNIIIDNLVANYYLDKNSGGVSVLSAEEDFTVSFPLSGATFSGFVRTIPTSYLKNSNDLKIISVTDATGSNIPYKTSYDKDKNLMLNVGDPDIKVYGNQTYSIRYQAKGVINTLKDHQEFYPNFNGRGWDVSFNGISATIHLSNSLAESLKNQPVCYIDSGNCQIQSIKKATETQIQVKALNTLQAHQSLTAKLSFKTGTFTAYKQGGLGSVLKKVGLLTVIIVGLLALLAGTRRLFKIIWHR